MATKGKKFVKKDTNGKKLSGIHIYIDEHERAIYYDVFSKTGYVLDGSEKAYNPYALRFFLSIFAAILATLFEAPLYLSIIIGLAVYIVMEIRFRIFLSKLPHVPAFVPKKRIGFIESSANEESSKLVIKIFLYLALAILIVLNAYTEGFEGFMLGANWLIACFGIYFVVLNFLGILRQMKLGTFQLKNK